MATATRNGSTRKPGKLAVSLALSIDHQVYALEPIRSELPEVSRAWRLASKATGNAYDVHQGPAGAGCDCPDQTWRHDGRDATGCKHIQALRLMGLLDPPPAPVPTPPPTDLDPFARTEAEEAATPGSGFPTGPCCPATGPAACVPCETATAPDDADTAPLDAAIPVGNSQPVNQPLALPDVLPDEAPELDPSDDFDPAELEDFDADDGATWELGPDPDGPRPTAQDLAEAAEVFGAMDAQRHLDRSDRLTLPELVDRQAEFYRRWANPVGAMLAKHMEEFALRIRWTKAETPADFEARHEIVEQDARQAWFKRGYEAGRQDCPCPHHGPLD
jgi:hypothetical protein